MCTITALSGALVAGDLSRDRWLVRVVCNRDELLTRAPALPPTLLIAGGRRVLMPIDPRSGGTWIAANDAGVVFVLLNAHTGVNASPGEISRGTIIPALVGSASVSGALGEARRLEVNRFAPFRLLILDQSAIVDCWPDQARLRHRRRHLRGSILRTSSALGDAVVSGPRRALFQRAFARHPDPRVAQDRFHDHQWQGREAISVNMRRHDARTVSRTVIEVRDASVSMSYQSIDMPHAVAVHLAA